MVLNQETIAWICVICGNVSHLTNTYLASLTS